MTDGPTDRPGPRRPAPRPGQYYNLTAPQREGGVSGPTGTTAPRTTTTTTSRGATVTVPKEGQWRGSYGSQRMGWNPDAFERFPYGSTTVAASDAVDAWLNLSPSYRSWIDQLAKNPNIGTRQSSGRMLWERAVGVASLSREQGENISPQQVLQRLAYGIGISDDTGSAPMAGPAGGGGSWSGGGGGGGVSRTVDITTPTGARALLTQAMQSALGRDPTAEEISTFTTSLNESQQASPTVVSAAGDTVTRTGGFEADVFAADFVRNQEEFQEVQATQFYRGLIDALTGGGI